MSNNRIQKKKKKKENKLGDKPKPDHQYVLKWSWQRDEYM